MARNKYTLNNAMEAVAKSLRDFGYPDADAQKMREVFDAWKDGKELPHGILGMFAERQFEEVKDQILKLPEN